MTTLALNSLTRSSARSPLCSPSMQGSNFRKRWLHQTLARQAIMMPAISPFMAEGTIRSWKKREGEAFSAGDVLLQIESDFAMIDVQAETAGVLGKILLPDGTRNVPVEQVIALIKSNRDLADLSPRVPAPPPYNPIPSPPSRTIPSPIHIENFSQPFMSPVHRSPSLFEMHSAHHHNRGIAIRRAHGPGLTIVPPSPRMSAAVTPASAISSAKMHTLNMNMTPVQEAAKTADEQDQIDGATIRRMIVSNLARTLSSEVAFSSPLRTGKCEMNEYFDGIL